MFDIGVKTEELTDAEKVFYEGQRGERKFRISEQIDSDYVAQKEQEWLKQQQWKKENLEFQGTIDADDVEIDEVSSSAQPNLNNSFTRSGLSRITKPYQSISTQTEYEVVHCKPPWVNEWVCTDDSKAVCTNLSSVVGISVEKAWKAVQFVCNDYYKDEAFLTKKDAVETMEKSLRDEPPSKKLKSDKVK